MTGDSNINTTKYNYVLQHIWSTEEHRLSLATNTTQTIATQVLVNSPTLSGFGSGNPSRNGMVWGISTQPGRAASLLMLVHRFLWASFYHIRERRSIHAASKPGDRNLLNSGQSTNNSEFATIIQCLSISSLFSRSRTLPVMWQSSTSIFLCAPPPKHYLTTLWWYGAIYIDLMVVGNILC